MGAGATDDARLRFNPGLPPQFATRLFESQPTPPNSNCAILPPKPLQEGFTQSTQIHLEGLLVTFIDIDYVELGL
ncbi:hypothetical protein [Streptomyces melanosporofaciens]|uniref:hypothetical protein n=1 Tax=Streptomyces melanosporofaciens TaxID=67327 RepID=UPI000B862163|nr:hypothetical protein [Streptomyces melanosporofaciens]